MRVARRSAALWPFPPPASEMGGGRAQVECRSPVKLITLASGRRKSEPPPSDHDQLPLVLHGRHHRLVLREERIDLAPHPELVRQVDARLDREADTGKETALLTRLQVVEVRAGAVQ